MLPARQLLLCATSLLLLPGSATGLSLFFRTSWAHEVPSEVFDAWFALIARGRAEGPSSPYYVESLGIQSVACSQQMPLGPPCNASAPRSVGCPSAGSSPANSRGSKAEAGATTSPPCPCRSGGRPSQAAGKGSSAWRGTPR